MWRVAFLMWWNLVITFPLCGPSPICSALAAIQNQDLKAGAAASSSAATAAQSRSVVLEARTATLEGVLAELQAQVRGGLGWSSICAEVRRGALRIGIGIGIGIAMP